MGSPDQSDAATMTARSTTTLAICASITACAAPVPTITQSQALDEARQACSVYAAGSQAAGACTREWARLRMGGAWDATSYILHADLQAANHCTRIGYTSTSAAFASCVVENKNRFGMAMAESLRSPPAPAPAPAVSLPQAPATCTSHQMLQTTIVNCF
jgi:hypothetical protein